MGDIQAVVYVSWGYWVADCPREGCLGAQHAGRDPNTGVVGQLTLDSFLCTRCGMRATPVWPPNAEDIWLVLQQRPLVESRSWLPHETIEDLLAENIVHGIMPAGLESGRCVRTVDGRIVDRALVAASRCLAIEEN